MAHGAVELKVACGPAAEFAARFALAFVAIDLGVVGGGGLGQMLAFHMSLFQMEEASTILISMIGLVVMVDSLSYWLRKSIER